MTVYFSGCKHNCEGCHNPISHDFDNGRPFTESMQSDLIDYIKNTPFIDGITLSGGDPMYSALSIIPFIKRIKSEFDERKITIWIYSGFTFEEICRHDDMFALLKLCDVLVDGPFVLSKKRINLKYKGSTNQRTIDIQRSLACGAVQLMEDIDGPIL